MHLDIYTFEDTFRFSMKEEANQREIGLDKLMPEPRFKQIDFDEKTGALRFKLGREGTALSNSKGVLELGREMRATATGASLGIQVVHDQELVRVPLMQVGPATFQFVLPRNFYTLRTDNLFAAANL